ncbi:MAG: dihydrofolate reductase [Rhizobacter sp.]|nr:dihydrofolate reductase [Ferruginibacter sp.]
MKKIIAVEWLSLDGYFSDANNGTDWLISGEEAQNYLLKMFEAFDTILSGQVTYEMFAAYWPKPNPSDKNPQALTDFMNNSRKVVFSKRLQNAQWNNTAILKDIIPEEISKMKQESGKDMVIFGSGSIVSQLTKLKLIDEYIFWIVPVFLGIGKTIFKSEEAKLKLKLLNTKSFDGGNMMLHYEATKN